MQNKMKLEIAYDLMLMQKSGTLAECPQTALPRLPVIIFSSIFRVSEYQLVDSNLQPLTLYLCMTP